MHVFTLSTTLSKASKIFSHGCDSWSIQVNFQLHKSAALAGEWKPIKSSHFLPSVATIVTKFILIASFHTTTPQSNQSNPSNPSYQSYQSYLSTNPSIPRIHLPSQPELSESSITLTVKHPWSTSPVYKVLLLLLLVFPEAVASTRYVSHSYQLSNNNDNNIASPMTNIKNWWRELDMYIIWYL